MQDPKHVALAVCTLGTINCHSIHSLVLCETSVLVGDVKRFNVCHMLVEEGGDGLGEEAASSFWQL